MEYNQPSQGSLGTSSQFHHSWPIFSKRTWGYCYLIGGDGQSRYPLFDGED